MNPIVHPAVPFLLRCQAKAMFRRIGKMFSTPRRFIMSTIALILAAAWLGNAVVSVLLREPLDPVRFRNSLPLGFFVYSAWHLLRASFKRPEVPIEWTEAEIENLCGSPLSRRDLLAYRFSGIASAGLIKALCFSLLMMPDLHSWLGGLVGILLALWFVDLWRMFVEILAWGIDDKLYRWQRIVMACIVGTLVVVVIASTFRGVDQWSRSELPISFAFLQHLLGDASSVVRDSAPGRLALAPFYLFSNVVTASAWSLPVIGSTLAAAMIVAGMVALVIRADGFFHEFQANRETMRYEREGEVYANASAAKIEQLRVPRIPWTFGIGPLAWRQALGANGFRASLIFSLAVPGVLACLPLFVYQDPFNIWINVLGALVFYSFLLLPTALKFDFRRDLDRFVILKTLPLRPLSIVAGELATPVLISTLYQITVFAIASLIRPLPLLPVLASIVLLLPLNVLIFATDNLFFLLYPYRVAQEGIAVFLRTTLTFTAKGLLFAAALAVTIFWAFAAQATTDILQSVSGLALDHRVIFAIGMWLFVCVCTTLAVTLVVRAFDRFDITQDLPQ